MGCGMDDASPPGELDATAENAATGVADGTVATGTSGTAGTGCGADAVCVATAPEGWQGPFVRRAIGDGKGAPRCPDTWPDAGLTLFDDYLEPGPTACVCACEVDLAAHCYSGVWRHEGSAECDAYSEFVVVKEGQCTEIAAPDGSLSATVTGFGQPNCKANLEADIPAPQWGSLFAACGGAEEAGVCEDGAGRCMPAPPDDFEESLCVFRAGDEPCPAGSRYPEKLVVYNGVSDDSRTCAPCECGEAPPVTCTGSVEAFRSEDCSGQVEAIADQDGCGGPIEAVQSVRITIDAKKTCDMLAPTEAMGTTAPSGIFTYCCEDARP